MDAAMWNAAEGVYESTGYNGSWNRRRMPTAFYPLISGTPSPQRAAAMMPLLTSPLGFCVNDSAHGAGDAGSTFLLQFLASAAGAGAAPGGALLCATDACVADALNARLTWQRVEGLAQVAPEPARRTIPLRTWRAGTAGTADARYALAPGDAPPAPGYALVRDEAHCFEDGGPPGRVPLSLWRRPGGGAGPDALLTCGGNPACVAAAAAAGFTLANGTLCYVFNGTTAEQLPCKFGVPSVARGDPLFFSNDYWRGRIWGPQVALVWLGLRRPEYAAVPEVQAARAVLVQQALRLELQEWRLFRQVTENMNGIFGAGEDVGNADPFYTWGALLGHVALLEAGF